jgi:glycosyltransferase involved in cell wall biosynthesis
LSPTQPTVLHVTEAAGGGVRRHLGYVVPALAKNGIRQGVVVSRERAEPGLDDDLAAWRALGIPVHVLPMRRGLSPQDPGQVLALRRLIRAEASQIVHAHATKAGLLARLAAPPGVHRIYSPHSFVFQEMTGVRRFLARSLERLLARRTERFVLVSPAESEVAKRELRIPDDRLRVVENGLPDSWAECLQPRTEVRAGWSVGPEERVVAVPARLAWQKGHDWLFQALAELVAEPHLQIRLMGAGPAEANLRRLAAELGIGHLLRWDGFVADAGHRLAGADLVVLPSRHEGLPYALLETLAAGVPLLVSDIPGNLPRPELREVATAVPCGNTAALVRALRDFLDRPAPWRERAALGPALQRRHWSLKTQSTGLLACYKEFPPC